jgi:FtsH-binding integral membrane protein
MVEPVVTRSDDSWEQEALPRSARVGFAGATVGLVAGCVIGFLVTSSGDLWRIGSMIGLGLFGAIAGAFVALAGAGVWRLLRRSRGSTTSA